MQCNWEVDDNVLPVLGSVDKPPDAVGDTSSRRPVKVSYLTEQTSHHPPVSAFFVDCPEKAITARGFDQLSAKFTGTSVRVAAGAHNLGIFVTLHERDNEQYQLTHPAAHLGGFLRGAISSVVRVAGDIKLTPSLSQTGSLNITVTDHCFIVCPKSKLKIILHYLAEGWLGRTQNKVEGVVFKYNPDADNKTKIKDVAEGDIVARIEGCWQDKLYYTLPKSNTKHLLIDLNPLTPVAKQIPPETEQLPNESRRFWAGVTEAIKAREFSKATSLKLQLEERQRDKAAARKAGKEEWQPRFFTGAVTPAGRPDLTKDGEEALRGLHENVFALKPSEVTGAY
ncbi:MAG: hypothetical protein M1837_004922 [Sclerophora amabilis]|nr:MAG: hypothetical protein M1837_004922 [Sclerophora amabilis]